MKSKKVLLVPIFYLTFSHAGPRERHGPLDSQCRVFIRAVNVDFLWDTDLQISV